MKIKVNTNQLEATAKILEEGIEKERKKYNSLKSEIEVKKLIWQGEDYKLFKTKWEEVIKNDSEFNKQLKMLESLAMHLKKVESEYESLQNKIITKAKQLPR